MVKNKVAYVSLIEVVQDIIRDHFNIVCMLVVEDRVHILTLTLFSREHNTSLMLHLIGHKCILAKVLG